MYEVIKSRLLGKNRWKSLNTLEINFGSDNRNYPNILSSLCWLLLQIFLGEGRGDFYVVSFFCIFFWIFLIFLGVFLERGWQKGFNSMINLRNIKIIASNPQTLERIPLMGFQDLLWFAFESLACCIWK